MYTGRVGSDRAMKVKNTFNPSIADRKLRAALELYANTAALKMEADAKRNAPWTDRTGNARNSIQGGYGWDGDKLVIILSGNVSYFVYLELANEKKYAILVPTTEKYTPEILSGFKKLVE